MTAHNRRLELTTVISMAFIKAMCNAYEAADAGQNVSCISIRFMIRVNEFEKGVPCYVSPRKPSEDVPLIEDRGNRTYVLHGIISRGRRKAEVTALTLYTNENEQVTGVGPEFLVPMGLLTATS